MQRISQPQTDTLADGIQYGHYLGPTALTGERPRQLDGCRRRWLGLEQEAHEIGVAPCAG